MLYGVSTRNGARNGGSRPTTIDVTPPIERAFLVAVDTGQDAGWTAEESLTELANLADTAGAEVVGAEWQNRRHVDPNWYVGKGKAEELVQAKSETGFTLLVADDELSPNQQKALESLLGVKVLDRSGLILDIFAQHARTHEGRLQVELAQLEYQLPRLTRLWTHLSRTQGGIGSRGPGETQLETDRRIIRDKIKKLKERVEQVRHQRDTAARSRDRRLVPTVAIVGYTNAGKSSMLNALVGSEQALAEDRALRHARSHVAHGQAGRRPAGRGDRHGGLHPQAAAPAGRRLPGHPRRGQPSATCCSRWWTWPTVTRRSTARRSSRCWTSWGRATSRGCSSTTRPTWSSRRRSQPDGVAPLIAGSVLVSAQTGYGMDVLRARLASLLAELWEEVDVALPYSEGELLSRVRERGTVDIGYRARDVRVRGRVDPTLASELRSAAAGWQGRAPDEAVLVADD